MTLFEMGPFSTLKPSNCSNLENTRCTEWKVLPGKGVEERIFLGIGFAVIVSREEP